MWRYGYLCYIFTPNNFVPISGASKHGAPAVLPRHSPPSLHTHELVPLPPHLPPPTAAGHWWSPPLEFKRWSNIFCGVYGDPALELLLRRVNWIYTPPVAKCVGGIMPAWKMRNQTDNETLEMATDAKRAAKGAPKDAWSDGTLKIGVD